LKKTDEKLYEISELITKVSFKDVLNDGCSKLEFSYVDDDLQIENGNAVQFKYGDVGIFSGIVFKHSKSKSKEITVTAYDMLRYCKGKDFRIIENETITTLATKMCNHFGLRKGIFTDTKYVLKTSIADGDPWIDIIYKAIAETLVNTGRKYCLRDEYGTIAIRDLADLKLDLVLGDESLCYDFSREKSIDDEFYNLVKIKIKTENAKEAGTTAIAEDDSSIKKFGLLQYYESVDSDMNYSQALNKAQTMLSLYNHENETLTLDCLGDTSIRAGSSFYAQISDISLNKRLIVKEVTHEFLPVHTMSLEVST
ncbi:XkdQ/YqbQ family protein, partial [Ruminiclostridium cellobioparum]|uniref:XkdQ/YqbQ family protein n=1 Tax=Ruminiclostridium cellobioparum TaxID=29355 RepID=UPI0028A67EE8